MIIKKLLSLGWGNGIRTLQQYALGSINVFYKYLKPALGNGNFSAERKYSYVFHGKKIRVPFFVYRNNKLVDRKITNEYDLKITNDGEYLVSVVPKQVLDKMVIKRPRLFDTFTAKIYRDIVFRVNSRFYRKYGQCYDLPKVFRAKYKPRIKILDKVFESDIYIYVPRIYKVVFWFKLMSHLSKPLKLIIGYMRDNKFISKREYVLTDKDYSENDIWSYENAKQCVLNIPMRICDYDKIGFWYYDGNDQKFKIYYNFAYSLVSDTIPKKPLYDFWYVDEGPLMSSYFFMYQFLKDIGVVKNVSAEVHLPGIIPVFSDKDLKIPVEIDVVPLDSNSVGVETEIEILLNNEVVDKKVFRNISKAYFCFNINGAYISA